MEITHFECRIITFVNTYVYFLNFVNAEAVHEFFKTKSGNLECQICVLLIKIVINCVGV